MNVKRLVRTIARPAGVVVATWSAAWLYWRTSGIAPTAGGLAVAGIVLPALVLLAITGLRSAFDVPARAAIAPVASSAPPSNRTTEAARHAPGNSLALLGASLCLPAGNTPEAVTAAARRAMMPNRHLTLVSSDGSPVFACDVHSLSPADFDPGSLDAEAAARLDITHRRALLLSANVLEKLFGRCEVSVAADIQADVSARAQPRIAADLHLLVPERWRNEASTLAAWLQAQVSRTPRPVHITTLHVHLLSGPQEALAVLDGVNTTLNATNSLARHIVLACDSRLAQADVNELERTGALHGRERPDGQIPAEAACALLVALPDYAASESSGDIAPAPHLHRLLTIQARREDNLDNSTATSPEGHADLADLLARAHKATAPAHSQSNPGTLVSDAGSHGQPRMDLASAAVSAWPAQLTPVHLDHLGMANGGNNGALTLSTIAVASALAAATQRTALAVSAGHAGSYAVVPISPPQTIATTTSTSAEIEDVVV